MKSRSPARGKWQAAEAAEHYATDRFGSKRARERDPRLVQRLLRRNRIDLGKVRVLDVPCGTGRLAPFLEKESASYLGADVSLEMVRLNPAMSVVADAAATPFADNSFEVVVCCRLLHHLDELEELPAVVRELVRISSGFVLASFWDAASLPAWRRRLGWRARSGRRPISKQRLADCFESSGAEVVDYAHSARFLSMQTFAAARVER